MKKVELSKRLKKVADFVKKDKKIVDIGSDHAYLPIYLVQNQLVPSAIAGEVVRGPYEKAKKEVANYGLTNEITTRLGSGFDVLDHEEEVGTVFICGMGGLLISEILETGWEENKIHPKTRLVLQPNNKEAELRKVLADANYAIIDEAIVKENNQYYEIIVATRSEDLVTYEETERLFGPQLMKQQSEIFKEKWQAIYENNQQIMKQLTHDEHKVKRKELETINEKIKKVIK